MSRRGHKAGIISSYHTTWLLKTDGKGCVWISDPIAYDCAGTQDRASVTEVGNGKLESHVSVRVKLSPGMFT